MQRRALLIDRDGTVCEDVGYLDQPQALHVLPGAAEALVAAERAGFQIVLVTNQAGVGHGRFDELTLDSIHDRLRELLGERGARVDGIYYCPHHPEALLARYRLDCACRKPKPGMLLRARDEMGIDLASSYLVGDHPRDIAAGAAAGATSVLVLTGHGRRMWLETPRPPDVRPDHVADDLAAAVQWILERERASATAGGRA
jgi:D-glycero-D-manno-heptose 1,7-bisphosphate phosphatase